MEVFEREAKRRYVVDKEKYRGFQVSLNSYNHLMFRWFDPNDQDKDVVIVLDSTETNLVFNYINKIISIARDIDRELRMSDC
jgi:hypothetical protein